MMSYAVQEVIFGLLFVTNPFSCHLPKTPVLLSCGKLNLKSVSWVLISFW